VVRELPKLHEKSIFAIAGAEKSDWVDIKMEDGAGAKENNSGHG
jgi:hypothetical protein